MAKDSRLELKFWGVRGSIPTPQQSHLVHGGNTACLTVRLPDDQVVIFDGGTGVRQLGRSLMREFAGTPLSLHLFLTHFHWDHIQGLPFFAPLYEGANEITFHSASGPAILEKMLQGMMISPYCPVQFESLPARRTLADNGARPVRLDRLVVTPFPLNHPQGAHGYRIEYDDAVIVYASDLEHGDNRLDHVLRDHASGADILVYDAQYTPEEYGSHRGWGHSTWAEGARVARDAGVKQLLLFHHDPDHNDDQLTAILGQARSEFEHTLMACDGLVLNL